MRVGVLGPLEVEAGGEVVAVGGARLRALLARLSLDAGRPVTVEALTQALWPGDPPADAPNAVQSLVSRLRRVLPANAPLRRVSGGYCLDIPRDDVDALRFERLAGEGRRALRSGAAQVAATRLREALALWRGDALADVGDAGAGAAARLEEQRLAAMEDRLEADLAAGAGHPVPDLEELIAAHPLRERPRHLLVQALHADGRPGEALAAYEQYRRLLAEELGADPGPDLQETHLALLRGERAVGRLPPRRPRTNLRAALTSFVGREADLRRLGTRIEGSRLVTLVGPGGTGKTRLATTLAAQIAEDFPGGAWLVELAPLTDPAEVPQALLDTLGLRDVGMLEAPAAARDPASRLVEALSATDTLLVMDNCEHLVEAVARLVDDLLGRCPLLRILATSREPLGILGEALFPVLPLALPEPDAAATVAAASPAVRLFADRAAAVRLGFTVGHDNVAAVGEICRRLDGLPLAIELAAARLRSLPLEEVAERLDHRFELLTGGSRTAQPRHRTLRAVVAWSWELLDAGERGPAERLAVFPASFSPDAAASLGASRDTLDALVDRSLLQVTGASPLRYRMLETIREYAFERLTEAGTMDRARADHAAYYLDLAERAEPHLRGFGQLPWIRTLEAERENLLAALHFALDAGAASTAVRLGAALSYFWTIQGDYGEAAGKLRLALEMPGGAPRAARTRLAIGYLLNAVLAGETAAAGAVAERLGPPHVPGPGPPEEGLLAALCALVRDDQAAGLAAVATQLRHPDAWTRGMAWLTRSFLSGGYGAMDEMRRDLTEAVVAFREAGDRWGLATSLTSLALAHTTFGDFPSAVRALEESMGLVREFGADDYQRVWLAMVRKHTGDVRTARAELLDVLDGATSTVTLALARISLADLARYDGDYGEAAHQLEMARGFPGLDDNTLLRAMLWSGTGQLAVATGKLGSAERRLREALTLANGMLDMPMVAMVGSGIARLRLLQGAPAAAAEVLGAAHALRGALAAADPDIASVTRELRAGLGEPAYRAAYDRGRRRDRAGALALLTDQLDASRSANTSRHPLEQNA